MTFVLIVLHFFCWDWYIYYTFIMRLFKLRTNYWPHLQHCSSNWTHWH